MGVPFATTDDVADRWRPLTPDEQNVAETLVSDASAIIRARFPGVDGQVDPDVLRIVVAGMVKRALVAPMDGVSQESESVGPINHSLSFANPMRNVFLTAADIILIEGYRPTGGTFQYGNTTTRQPSIYGPMYYSR